MLIQTRGEVIECQPKRGAKSAPSVLWLKLSIPMDALGDAEIAKLSRFLHGPTIGLTLDVGGPFVASDTGKSGKSGNGRQATIEEVAPAPTTASRRPERVTPLPDEKCQRCFDRIGEDPDRRFYAPTLGTPQPMHGRCADLSDAERDAAAAGQEIGPGPAEADVQGEDDAQPGTMQPTAEGAPKEPEQQEPTVTAAGAIVAMGKLTMTHAGPMLVDVELLAPPPEPVPTELPAPAAVETAPATEEEGWAATSDPRPSRVADPEAAAALGDLPPHLERVAASTDETFEQLVGPSAATRKRRSKATV